MMDRMIRFLVLAAMAMVMQLASATASMAQNWPTRAVRLILPFGAGSGADIAARLLVEKLQALWGQPVVIEGKPGGDGLISIGTVVNGKDDHILFFGPSSAYVVHPYVHDNLSYDPEKDLQPVAGVAKVQVAIAVSTSIGVANLKEFVALARANPEKISYAVAPGFSEFVFDGFLRENDLKIAKVPYRDITTSPTDLGENRIQLVMLSYAAMRSHEENGKIKIIAINDDKRSPTAPNIPSVVETGYPSLVASPILGIMGHRDMPLALRRKIATDVVAVLQDTTIRERLALSGQPAAPMNVEEFAAGVNEQHAQVARIAKVLGLARKK
jgi:tripartite-type tricarboxylate transporter receptor subunit TctC